MWIRSPISNPTGPHILIAHCKLVIFFFISIYIKIFIDWFHCLMPERNSWPCKPDVIQPFLLSWRYISSYYFSSSCLFICFFFIYLLLIIPLLFLSLWYKVWKKIKGGWGWKMMQNQFSRSSYRESLKGLEADIQHANTLWVLFVFLSLLLFVSFFLFFWLGLFTYGCCRNFHLLKLDEGITYKKNPICMLVFVTAEYDGLMLFFMGFFLVICYFVGVICGFEVSDWIGFGL